MGGTGLHLPSPDMLRPGEPRLLLPPAPAHHCSQLARRPQLAQRPQSHPHVQQHRGAESRLVCAGRREVPFTASASESRRTAAGGLTVSILVAGAGEPVGQNRG